MPAMSAAAKVRPMASFSSAAPRPCHCFHCHGQPSQHHQRNRMSRQPLADALRCLLRAYLTHHQGLEANHPFRFERHISAAGAGPLVGQGEANQETVQGFVATIKALQGLAGLQRLDPVTVQPASTVCACSNTLGCCSNRASRGWTLGGASRAATNASHCSGSKWKLCRSASVSAALARALFSTKSVTLRFATAAARCRVCMAPGVSRRSSFSLRKGVDFKAAAAMWWPPRRTPWRRRRRKAGKMAWKSPVQSSYRQFVVDRMQRDKWLAAILPIHFVTRELVSSTVHNT